MYTTRDRVLVNSSDELVVEGPPHIMAVRSRERNLSGIADRGVEQEATRQLRMVGSANKTDYMI